METETKSLNLLSYILSKANSRLVFPKMKNTFLTFVIALLAVPGFSQQQLEKLFQINADASHPWFSPEDNMTRGMAVNPKGNVLVADRFPVDTVYRLDPFTGEEKGELKTQALSGGAFMLNKIVATSGGRIFVSNLSTGQNPFKIYYYYDELSEPFVVYDDPAPGARWGDDLAVIGSGTGIQLLVTGSDNLDVMILNDFDGDGKYSSRIVTPINPSLLGITNVSFDLDQKTFWTRQSTAATGYCHQYTLNEGIGSKTGFNSVTGVGPMDINIMNGKLMMALGPGIVTEARVNENRAYLLDLDSSIQAKYQTGLLVSGDGNKNTNGSGDVVLSTSNSTLHVLYTNNSISGWRVPKQ